MALIGETGSGKSTLVQHLNGLIYPTKGKITIGDYCIEGGQKSTKELKIKTILWLSISVSRVSTF